MLPAEFLVEVFIPSAEEKQLGILPEYTTAWRNENEIPGTDGIEEMRHNISKRSADCLSDSEGRITQKPRN
jgi:hypothetical protein